MDQICQTSWKLQIAPQSLSTENKRIFWGQCIFSMFVESPCNWQRLDAKKTCQEEDAEADAEEQAEMAEVNEITCARV